MSVMKTLIDEILNCDYCNGHGYIGWVDNSTGDFDLEYCDCNPHRLSDPKQVA